MQWTLEILWYPQWLGCTTYSGVWITSDKSNNGCDHFLLSNPALAILSKYVHIRERKTFFERGKEIRKILQMVTVSSEVTMRSTLSITAQYKAWINNCWISFIQIKSDTTNTKIVG